MGLGVQTDGRTDGRTDSHVTTKIFEIDELPNFLSYGAPLARLRRAGAPLKFHQFHMNFKICFRQLVLLEVISFENIFKTVAQNFAT